MKLSQAEKMEVIHVLEESALSVRRTLEELEINRSTFYAWYRRYLEDGYDGLAPAKSVPSRRTPRLINTGHLVAFGTEEGHHLVCEP